MTAFGVITQAKTCPRRQHSQRDVSRGGLKERSAPRRDTLTAPLSFLVSVLFPHLPREHTFVSLSLMNESTATLTPPVRAAKRSLTFYPSAAFTPSLGEAAVNAAGLKCSGKVSRGGTCFETRGLSVNSIWLLTTCNLIFTPYCVGSMVLEDTIKKSTKSGLLCVLCGLSRFIF